jgi:hypothetical protein
MSRCDARLLELLKSSKIVTHNINIKHYLFNVKLTNYFINLPEIQSMI